MSNATSDEHTGGMGVRGRTWPGSDYSPPWFLRSGHIQTVITGFYRPIATLPTPIVHQIPIGSDGHMLVHENCPKDSTSDTAILLLHGLGSSHSGTYMTNIAQTVLQLGGRVFRVDLPGAGRSFETTRLPPHGACYDQIRMCLNHLSDQLQIRKWRIAGVSLGANILLKLLGESEKDPHRFPLHCTVERAMAVAPPIDLAECCKNIERGMNRLYSSYFIKALKRQARERGNRWESWREVLKSADYSSIRKFDETVTSKLAGFANAEDYYRAGSSQDVLDRIKVPTLLLVDTHDPIVPIQLFENRRYSPSIQVITTNFGGHVGYLQKSRNHSSHRKGAWQRWADYWIAETLMDEKPW